MSLYYARLFSPRAVFDASVDLAVLQGEKGADQAAPYLRRAAISAVNLSEVAGKLTDAGMTTGDVRELLGSLGLVVVSFDEEAAHNAAQLRQVGGAQSLSLGDRACLALARSIGLTAFTTDRFWERSAREAGIELRIIRR